MNATMIELEREERKRQQRLEQPGLIGCSMKPRRCAGRPTSALTLMP